MGSRQNKVVFITGAAGGLGHSLAQSFASEDYRLFLTDKNEERLLQIVEELRSKGVTVEGKPMTLSDSSTAREISEIAFRAYGRIDVLVNNAGVSRAKSFWDLSEEDWNLVLDVNVKALFCASGDSKAYGAAWGVHRQYRFCSRSSAASQFDALCSQ